MSVLVRTAPEAGRSSPAMSLSRVDLPEPLTPISPVRPSPMDRVRPDSTRAPSGQLKLRSEQTMAVMAAGSQHVGRIFLYVWRHHAARAQPEVMRTANRPKRGIADLRTSTPLSRRRDQNRPILGESGAGQEEVSGAGAADEPVGGGEEAGAAAADLGRLTRLAAEHHGTFGAQHDPGALAGQGHGGADQIDQVQAELRGRSVEPGDPVGEPAGGQDRHLRS